MKHITVMIMACTMYIFLVHGIFAEEQESMYMDYIDSPVYNYTETTINEELSNAYAQDNVADKSYSIQRGLLLFWLGFLNMRNEEIVSHAVEYWEHLYSLPMYKNPLTLAIYGTVQAMHGGAILTPQPIKKTRLAVDGMAKLTDSVAQLDAENDYLALAFVYFLSGMTRSFLPNFFQEQKLAPRYLKNSLSNISKARKQRIYEKELIYFLVAYIYRAYGEYYMGEGSVRKAKQYFTKALNYLEELDEEYILTAMIQEKMEKLR